nr:MAG TPA: hypothetical protein [Caudoviricetes sp.]
MLLALSPNLPTTPLILEFLPFNGLYYPSIL